MTLQSLIISTSFPLPGNRPIDPVTLKQHKLAIVATVQLSPHSASWSQTRVHICEELRWILLDLANVKALSRVFLTSIRSLDPSDKGAAETADARSATILFAFGVWESNPFLI